MPRLQIDLPARDLQDVEAMTGDSVWPTPEAAVRYIVADYLETLAWTPEYAASVKAKLDATLSDPDGGRDMDEVFDQLEAKLTSMVSKAS